jgi:hypothetical protein
MGLERWPNPKLSYGAVVCVLFGVPPSAQRVPNICIIGWKAVVCESVLDAAVGMQTSGRESIAAKLTSNLITEAGADRVLVVDLHSGQGVGYFDIPVDLVYAQVRRWYLKNIRQV